MMWFFAVLVVLAMGAVAVVASGRTGALPEEFDDRPDARVPTGPLSGSHLRQVRFSLALRGYRMSEVDTLLARLADQLDDGAHNGAHADADAARDPHPEAARGGDEPD